MSTITSLDIGPVKFITTDQDGPTSLAAIQANGSLHNLTLEDIGNISEFLATAWLNLSGEEYKPVYVGTVVHQTILSERDCE